LTPLWLCLSFSPLVQQRSCNMQSWDEHRRFTGSRTLTPFFDKLDLRSLDDWQHRLCSRLARSRLFLAFLSPN